MTGRFSTSGWRPWEWCFRWGHHSYYLCISKSRHQGEPEITDSRSSPGVDGGGQSGHGVKGQPTCYSKNLPNYRMTSFTNAFSSQWVFESWGIGFQKWHKFPFFSSKPPGNPINVANVFLKGDIMNWASDEDTAQWVEPSPVWDSRLSLPAPAYQPNLRRDLYRLCLCAEMEDVLRANICANLSLSH